MRGVIQGEFGRPPEELFEWFDGEPAASASIAQVHRARLVREARPVWGDTLPAGADVVVKVLRPGVEEAVMADLELGRRLIRRAGALGAFRRLNADRLLDEFAASFHREIDLRNEARVADRFAFDFRDDPARLRPRVVWREDRRARAHHGVRGGLAALRTGRAPAVPASTPTAWRSTVPRPSCGRCWSWAVPRGPAPGQPVRHAGRADGVPGLRDQWGR